MFFRLIFLLYNIDAINAKIIKNINLPSCINCIHYKPALFSGYYSDLSKCGYFGSKNIQSDVIHYDYTDSCRNDETKCGLEGKYFVKNENLLFTILLYNIKNNVPFISMTIIILSLLLYEEK